MSLTNYNLNTGFMKPEDVRWVADRLKDVEDNRSDANLERVAQLLWSYKATAYTVKGKGVLITYSLFEPTKRMGSVNITGSKIDFKNTELFTAIAKLASNFEVFPKTDGTVQINFTFHGLTK